MSKQLIMSFDNYMKLCEMIESINSAVDKHNTNYFLAKNVKEYELENVDGEEVDKIEAKLDYINSTITGSRISQEVKGYALFYLQDIKTHILTTQQQKRELEELRRSNKEMREQLDEAYSKIPHANDCLVGEKDE